MSQPQRRFDKESLLQFANDLAFFKLIGLRVVDLGPGYSKCEIDFRSDLCQPAGILHGGITATLIDTGIAHSLLMTEAFERIGTEGGSMVSVDLRIKFFRPVSDGHLICESTIPRLGRQIVHGESVVTNAAGKEIARGDSIYMFVPRQQLTRPAEK